MVWDKSEIVKTLKKLHKDGVDLSYNALAATQQSLVSAAAYHFGSYRKAIEKAGIEYHSVIRRPRWTKAAIIALVKSAKRQGEDLHWSSVTQRRDELGKAAFASLQPRLFGSWDRALTAAGLDADDVNRYRKWNKETIAFELRARARDHEALNSGALQQDEPGLHAAAVRHFGSYDEALRAAKLDPEKLRQRRSWTKQAVKDSLKTIHRDGNHLSDSAVRNGDPALYGAAVRLFGSFTAARSAAGIKWKK
ncbi:MAG TPA: hypothetical protein VFE47_26345 [Tepidisphaeraceae bacterium]|jgi:hypothetical protein|nr:hypothetical protein [Tepidisphaeraceae bacterium]